MGNEVRHPALPGLDAAAQSMGTVAERDPAPAAVPDAGAAAMIATVISIDVARQRRAIRARVGLAPFDASAFVVDAWCVAWRIQAAGWVCWAAYVAAAGECAVAESVAAPSIPLA